jgi:hypothetical protein
VSIHLCYRQQLIHLQISQRTSRLRLLDVGLRLPNHADASSEAVVVDDALIDVLQRKSLVACRYPLYPLVQFGVQVQTCLLHCHQQPIELD